MQIGKDNIALVESIIAKLDSGKGLYCQDNDDGFYILSKWAYGIKWIAIYSEENGSMRRKQPYVKLSDELVYSWISTLIDEGVTITSFDRR